MNNKRLSLRDFPVGFIRTMNEELCFLFFNDCIFINTCHYSSEEYKTVIITRQYNDLEHKYCLIEHTHYLPRKQTLKMVNKIIKESKKGAK